MTEQVTSVPVQPAGGQVVRPMIKFGDLKIDPAAYGSQGNAVLGIRDSGKTYTATYLAEKLFERGIPFITFDPTGVWRFLRVPGNGRGYPIVVAGGEGADLPLNEASAPKIVEAAMQGGVSLVINLFDEKLSKASWRRIVKDCISVLIHKNHKHGLRHIFLEEAAEFVPQKVLDGEVYAVIEKLARMGGNFRLGYTLINQRSQEVNKAVLELCENLFLHRQRGKNALENLKKWLEVASDDDADSIMKSISNLDTGKCWAWMGGSDPVLIKVPAKNSFHPDRRVMHGNTSATTAQAVDVGTFVSGLKNALPAIEADAKANDPAELRKEIAALKKQIAKPAVDIPAVDEPRIRSEGYNAGWAAAMRELNKERAAHAKTLSAVSDALARAQRLIPDAPPPVQSVAPVAPKLVASRPIASRPAPVAHTTPPDGLSSRHMRILNAVAWWKAAGIEEPTRAQVAGAAGYAPSNGNFNNLVGAVKTAGLIEYPTPGTVRLTAAGETTAEHQEVPTTEELHGRVRAILESRHVKLFDAVVSAYPDALTREQLAEATGYQPGNGNFNNLVGKLSGLEIVTYPQPGHVRAADWLFL